MAKFTLTFIFIPKVTLSPAFRNIVSYRKSSCNQGSSSTFQISVVIWLLTAMGDMDDIERVQRKFTKRI